MSRTTRLALGAVSLFLVLFPLTLGRPGSPAGLKADEPAYFLMALSLAHDGDLAVDTGDLGRLFEAFPFSPARNLVLMTDDGWHTVYYGKPFVYSLFAAPAVALAGASGMLAFNMALLVGMIWLGAFYLSRFNPSGIAALFSAGFFVLSAGFAYVFWLQPEVFNMAAVAASLFLLFRPAADGVAEPPPIGRWRRATGWLRRPESLAALSGGALALAVYNKPMLAVLGLAPAVVYLRRRRHGGWRRAITWGLGFALVMGLAAGVATALTGHPTSYIGVARGGFEVCSPDEMPVVPQEVPDRVAGKRSGSWSWIFYLPRPAPRELVQRVTYFLFGRHTGLFLYFPFSLVALGLFLRHERRSPGRWALLASLAGVALFFLLWIPSNYHGGGGFIGNRYFVNAYPGLLFLVTRLAPVWTTVAGWVLGGLFLGGIVFTPLGRSVPFSTLQAHVRNAPFRLFPLELSLKGVPGYETLEPGGGVRLLGRNDLFLPRGESGFWVRGGAPAELLVIAGEPLEPVELLVGGHVAGSRIRVSLADAEATVAIGPGAPPEGEAHRVTLAPTEPSFYQHRDDYRLPVYRLTFDADRGAVRTWTIHAPPRTCTDFAYNERWEDSFYVGAEVVWLGAPERLERDVFGARWQRSIVPRRVAAGAELEVQVRLVNASRAEWPASGPVRVGLAYHWETPAGERVVQDGLRTPLPRPVAPGETVRARMRIDAPAEPGRWILVLDPIYEHVAWFSDRDPASARRVPVEVVPAAGAADPGDD